MFDTNVHKPGKPFGMTDPISEPGARISATVKWYDAAKRHGVLDPGDGSAEVFCSGAALHAVGMEVLLAGAAVTCETAQGRFGPEVSRILAVDFSEAAPREAPFARAPGNGAMAERGAPRAAAAPDRTVRGIVKWFMPSKGYGFIEPEDGTADLFCHMTAVQASGHETLPQGAVVTCEIVQGDRGPQVSRLLSMEPPAFGAGPADRDRPRYEPRDRFRHGDAPAGPVMELPGTVKFYDPIRGFGFVVPDDGGREVFVHSSVLQRSGMADLAPGQRVFVRAESVPRGLQARDIEPI